MYIENGWFCWYVYVYKKVLTVRTTTFEKAEVEGGSASIEVSATETPESGLVTFEGEEVSKSDRLKFILLFYFCKKVKCKMPANLKKKKSNKSFFFFKKKMILQ